MSRDFVGPHVLSRSCGRRAAYWYGCKSRRCGVAEEQRKISKIVRYVLPTEEKGKMRNV